MVRNISVIVLSLLLAAVFAEGVLRIVDQRSYNDIMNDPETGLFIYRAH